MNVCKFCGYYEGQTLQCDACKARDELDHTALVIDDRDATIAQLRAELDALKGPLLALGRARANNKSPAAGPSLRELQAQSDVNQVADALAAEEER